MKGDNVWTETHRQQLQQGSVSDPPDAATVVHELAHPVVPLPSSARLPPLPLGSPLLPSLSLSCCLPLCVRLHSAMCVRVCARWTDDAAGSRAALAAKKPRLNSPQ